MDTDWFHHPYKFIFQQGFKKAQLQNESRRKTVFFVPHLLQMDVQQQNRQTIALKLNRELAP